MDVSRPVKRPPYLTWSAI